MNATKRPWRVEYDEWARAYYIMPNDEKAGYIAQCAYPVGNITKEVAGANAEVIVRAVNSFQELVEALKRFLDEDNSDKAHNSIDCKTEPCRYCFGQAILTKAGVRS